MPLTSSTRRLVTVASVLVVATLAATTALPGHADDTRAACPEVFAHGGYPTGADAWERDQVRQPNNPEALRAYRNMGAAGVEADLQLTKNGHKAVMWHNTSTYWLTGSKKDITELWWATGEDQLSGRTIEVGPFKGETVYSLRQYLDAAHAEKLVPLIEIKKEAAQSLLNDDAAVQDGAWAEVIDPIAERVERQEILVYTHDTGIRPQLESRFTAAGLAAVLGEPGAKPVWPDAVDWEEPPPSSGGNHDSWRAALADEPRRMATDWPEELNDWLDGQCG